MEKVQTNIFKTSFYLHSYEVDKEGKAFPHSIMNYMLHSAWQHVDKTEFSYEALAEEDNLWVLSRFKVNVLEFPIWGEHVSIETWGKGTDKLFALRDFAMYKENGIKAASATSAWLVLNRNNMRPQRMNKLNESFLFYPDKHEIHENLEKIIIPGNTEPREIIKAHFSDIDVNRHVSSANYIKWMLDSTEEFNMGGLKSFEINYLSEAHLGDLLSINSFCEGNMQYSSITRETNKAELCRARFEWA